MRDNDGRKLDHKTLEQVRIRVVRQVERGARPEYLASVLGFARSTVFGWMARYRRVAWMSSKLGPYRSTTETLWTSVTPDLHSIVGNDHAAFL